MSKSYFTYVLAVNRVPFYVGKGSGTRHLHHFKQARSGSRKRLYKEMRRVGLDRIRVRIIPATSENEAFAREKKLISKYGIRPTGSLINGTLGGGASGSCYTEAVCKRISKAAKRQWHNPNTRKKITAGIRRFCKSMPAKERKRRADVMQQLTKCPDARKNLSIAMIKRFKRIGPTGIAARSGWSHTPEAKAKIAAASRARIAAGYPCFKAGNKSATKRRTSKK